MTMAEMQRLALRPYQEVGLVPMLPQPVETMKATGIKFGNRVEWAQSPGVDGYRIAAMPPTVLNLAAPQKLFTVMGDSSLEFVEDLGDIATQRFYSVQSFKKSTTGETYFSEWRYPLVNATSKNAAGAADPVPTPPPSAPITPEDSGTPGDPGGIGREDQLQIP